MDKLSIKNNVKEICFVYGPIFEIYWFNRREGQNIFFDTYTVNWMAGVGSFTEKKMGLHSAAIQKHMRDPFEEKFAFKKCIQSLFE